MLDRPVCDLGSNKEVGQGSYGKKPTYAPQDNLAIELRLGQTFTQLAPAQPDSNWNDRQSSKKDYRNNQENYDSKVRIARVTPNALR